MGGRILGAGVSQTGRFWYNTADVVVSVIQVLVESSRRMPLFAVEDVDCAVEDAGFDRV